MPRLTDQEKADVLRHLEADKPLPDHYDKREVELVWNGKTAATPSGARLRVRRALRCASRLTCARTRNVR